MATILTETFNAYNDGDLNGQGSWVGDTDFDIQGVTVKEGAKAVKIIASGASTIYKDGTATSGDGRITIYVAAGQTNLDLKTHFMVGATVYGGIYVDDSGDILGLYGTGLTTTILSSYAINTYYCLEMEWRISDDYIRFRYNEGTWGSWLAPWYARSMGDADRIQLEAVDGATGYWDYIAEDPYVAVTFTPQIIHVI